MSQNLYKVIISGSASGKPDEAAEKLASLLNLPKTKAAELLKKAPAALDKIVPLATAQQYQSRLKEAGILCTLEPTEAANDSTEGGSDEEKEPLSTGMFANLSLEASAEPPAETKTEEKAEQAPAAADEKIQDQFAQISEEIGNTINVMEDDSGGKKSKGPAPVAPGNMRCPQCKTEQKKAPVCSNCNADIAALVGKPNKVKEIKAPPGTGDLPEEMVAPKPSRRKPPPPPPKPKFTGFTFLLILALAGVLGGTYVLQNMEEPKQTHKADNAVRDLNKTKNKLLVLRDTFKNMVATAKNIDPDLAIPSDTAQVISFLNLVDRDIYDSWGNSFVFKIDGKEYSFTSKGRDKKLGTGDDIVLNGVLVLPVAPADEPVQQPVTDGTGEATTTDPAAGTTEPAGQVQP